MAARKSRSKLVDPAPNTVAAPTTPRRERPLMTVEEVIAAWQGEWALMRVLAFDLRGWPYYGEIVAHSPDRGAISEALAGEPRPNPPGSTPYSFSTPFHVCLRGRSTRRPWLS
jgi:hypothetical protein